VELGFAGTLIKHARMGQTTGILDLTEGELSTRGTVELRRKEAADAAKVMGAAVRMNAGMRDGFFENDEAHRLRLIGYIRLLRPEIVITNSLEDRHPDHGRAGRLVADACFYAGLRQIKTQWDGATQDAWRPKRVLHCINDRIHVPDFIVDTSDCFEAKMEAIKCYKSQFHDPSSNEPMTYISAGGFLDNIEARDSLWGKRIGVRYGEGFNVETTPGIHSLDALVLPELP
jgi:N-acetylglucosamine malate deacetylase 1